MFFLEDGEKITRETKFDAGFLLACAVLTDRGLSETIKRTARARLVTIYNR